MKRAYIATVQLFTHGKSITIIVNSNKKSGAGLLAKILSSALVRFFFNYGYLDKQCVYFLNIEFSEKRLTQFNEPWYKHCKIILYIKVYKVNNNIDKTGTNRGIYYYGT
jgi:hypothetical protein